MLRSAFLRPAGVCRAALHATSTSLLQQAPKRILTAGARREALALASLRSYQPLPRFYSSETQAATATETVEDVQSHSGPITRFADLDRLGVHPVIVQSITQGMRYEDMTEVQSMAIRPALNGKDMVAQAKTGTGKTLAFLIPVVQKILDSDPSLASYRTARTRARPNDIRAIIISPTRELAEQIGEEARKLCRGTGIKIQTAVGGTGKRDMLRRVQSQGCHLLVATPGRLNDILEDPYSGIEAPNLQALVLDEADRMLDVGFEQELQEIIRKLPDRSEVPRQTLLFSATIPKNVVGLARTYIDPKNFEFCQTIRADDVPTHEKVPQYIVTCKGTENTFPALLELMKKEMQKTKQEADAMPFKAIVYLPTTAQVQLADATFDRLSDMHRLPEVLSIHSKLTQDRRTRVADRFKKIESGILFSSDVTARGMDFPNVSHVIQLHCPNDRDQYIHRIGRTGRANKAGQAWLLISEIELRGARDKLAGIPINRHTELESASFDARSEDAESRPQLYQDVTKVMKRLRYDLVNEAYNSMLGGALQGVDKRVVCEDLYYSATTTWGLEEPPAIPPRKAHMMGVARLNTVRIAEPEERSRDDDRGGYGGRGRDRFGGGGRGGGGRGGFRGGDRFDAMRSDEGRRESRPSRPRASF